MLVPEECIGTGIFLRHLWSATWHSMRAVGKFIRTCFATIPSLDVPWVTEVTWQPRGQGLNAKGWSRALWILSQFGTGAWISGTRLLCVMANHILVATLWAVCVGNGTGHAIASMT